MQDRATDLLLSGAAGEDVSDGAYEHVQARVQALVSAARDLSDTCADLADALRPLPGHEDTHDFGRLRAERTAALLDEAASAARGTLGLLHSAYSALERQVGRPPAPEPATPSAGASTWSGAFVEAPSRTFSVEDEAGTVPAPRRAEPDPLPAVRSAAGPPAGEDANHSAGGEHRFEDRYAVGDADRDSGAGETGGGAAPGDAGRSGVGRLGHPDRRERDSVSAVALAGWVALDPDDEDAGGRPILAGHDDLPWNPDDRPTGRDADVLAEVDLPGPPDDRPAGPADGGSAPGAAADLPHLSTDLDDRSTWPDPDRTTLGDDQRSSPADGDGPTGRDDDLPITGAHPPIWPDHDRTTVGDDQPAGREPDQQPWPGGGPPAAGSHQLAGGGRDPSTVRDGDRPTWPDHDPLAAGDHPAIERPTWPDHDPLAAGDQPAGRDDERPTWPDHDPLAAGDHPAAAASRDASTVENGDRPARPEHDPMAAESDQPAGRDRDRSTWPGGDQLTVGDQPAGRDDDRSTWVVDRDPPTVGGDDRLTGGDGGPSTWPDRDPWAAGDDRPAVGDGGLPTRSDGDPFTVGEDRLTLVDRDRSTWSGEDPLPVDEDQSAGWDSGGLGWPDGDPLAGGDAERSAWPHGDPLAGGDAERSAWPHGDPLAGGDAERSAWPHGGGPEQLAGAAEQLAGAAEQLAAAAEQLAGAPEQLPGGRETAADDEAVLEDDRPTRTMPAQQAPVPVLTLPVDPHSGDGPGWHGDTVSPEPRSLSLVPPVPEPEPDPDVGDIPYLPEPAPYRDEVSDVMPAPDANTWTAEPRSSWQPVPGLSSRPVWAAEVAPGASAAGDGLPVYPLDTDDVPPLAGAHAMPAPSHPLDDPGAAMIARQVEAARRHLQAALLVANQPAQAPRLGALLTAVEQVLTAVTDLARETRGVLESGLTDRTFPGEARFLCSQPWERVELVGRDAYGDDMATTSGLAKLLRALGYEATSVTSAGGVAGVQVRSDRYSAHIALVEPAGGGRQRWSGALEWQDATGASRTWAETLGPVELEDEELARRVDELLRRCVGPAR